MKAKESQNQFINASEFLSYLINEDWVDDRLLEWGGRIALEENQWAIGEEIFSCLLERRSKPEDLVSLAHCLARQGRYEEGEECLLEALVRISDPSLLLFCIYKNLGDISLLKRNFPLSEEYYNKAYTIRPVSVSLQFQRGILSLKQKNHKTAIRHFIRVLNCQPDHDKAWLGLAVSRKALGDEELAGACLLRSLDFNPQNRTALELKHKWQKPFCFALPLSLNFSA